eukprot:TRINITY_DN11400_c0_g1_i1.p1 TRINITY_DN11400_c0_g1~~TRINITY_DN11400_c0_g1_i1.p1  ORF type:complete len:176 (-),score=29.36 TRINITY_DN11400_c0_g1_i1:43-570(-)
MAETYEKIDGHLKRFLAHERTLFLEEKLQNVTHRGSSSVWLDAASSEPPIGMINVYRPMGDTEILYLVQNGILPDTQPYQAIMEGESGRIYAEKYLNGKKWTDTHPTTVVEFTVPGTVIDTLKARQIKVEDGALSMGLGNKAGKGLPIFNDSIRSGSITWRIVKVKRPIKTKEKK